MHFFLRWIAEIPGLIFAMHAGVTTQQKKNGKTRKNSLSFYLGLKVNMRQLSVDFFFCVRFSVFWLGRWLVRRLYLGACGMCISCFVCLLLSIRTYYDRCLSAEYDVWCTLWHLDRNHFKLMATIFSALFFVFVFHCVCVCVPYQGNEI